VIPHRSHLVQVQGAEAVHTSQPCRTRAWSRQEKAEARGLGKARETRCGDPVGESEGAQVPPAKRLASGSVATPPCSSSHGGAERGGAR
jgi:hypothetical protein